jgi:hypothetical protein
MNDHDVKGRAARAFHSLEEGDELARRRIWTKVQLGIQLDRRRRHRRARLSAGAAALVASIAVGVAAIWQPFAGADDGTAKTVSVDAVWDMLASQPGASAEHGSLDEFVLSVAVEEQTGAQ